ncbi:MAG: prephenate dehydratase [Methanobacterium paludis]|nr:prephenate dehydratase [Methanobacterium paludis]
MIKKIATLGPRGTFSEIAAQTYIKNSKCNAEIIFCPTITKVFNAAEKECDISIVPIENTLDGHVQISLDLLLKSDLKIVNELILPIQFAFVANCIEKDDIKKIYAQFKTQGQCYSFLEQFPNIRLITTDSNGESFERVKDGIQGEGAIVPINTISDNKDFPFCIENVTDSVENETRFLVLSKKHSQYIPNKKYKTSIAIMNAGNQPGILYNILNSFYQKNINLTSIMSRPTKKGLGEYYFFIDVDGRYPEDNNIKKVIEDISKKNIVKVLGSYALFDRDSSF